MPRPVTRKIPALKCSAEETWNNEDMPCGPAIIALKEIPPAIRPVAPAAKNHRKPTARCRFQPTAPNQISQTSNNSQGSIMICLLYTSDAADERSSVDLGGRRI